MALALLFVYHFARRIFYRTSEPQSLRVCLGDNEEIVYVSVCVAHPSSIHPFNALSFPGITSLTYA